MKVYLITNTETTWTSEHQQLLSFVSKERQNKILRYKFDDDKILSLNAALLTRIALSRILNISPASLEFTYVNNKPMLIQSNTESSADIHFNFAHTRHAIVLGVSTASPVGADIEKVSTPPLEIISSVFHADEKAYIYSGDEENLSSRFFEIWTKKEAYTKYIGTGLTDNINTFNTMVNPLSNILYTHQIDNYIYSICSNDSIEDTIVYSQGRQLYSELF